MYASSEGTAPGQQCGATQLRACVSVTLTQATLPTSRHLMPLGTRRSALAIPSLPLSRQLTLPHSHARHKALPAMRPQPMSSPATVSRENPPACSLLPADTGSPRAVTQFPRCLATATPAQQPSPLPIWHPCLHGYAAPPSQHTRLAASATVIRSAENATRMACQKFLIETSINTALGTRYIYSQSSPFNLHDWPKIAYFYKAELNFDTNIYLEANI